MRAKYVDVAHVATDDVRGWFEACETEAECAELAKDTKDVIDAIAATNAEWLSCPDDMYDLRTACAHEGRAVRDAENIDAALSSSESHEDGRLVMPARIRGRKHGIHLRDRHRVAAPRKV